MLYNRDYTNSRSGGREDTDSIALESRGRVSADLVPPSLALGLVLRGGSVNVGKCMHVRHWGQPLTSVIL